MVLCPWKPAPSPPPLRVHCWSPFLMAPGLPDQRSGWHLCVHGVLRGTPASPQETCEAAVQPPQTRSPVVCPQVMLEARLPPPPGPAPSWCPGAAAILSLETLGLGAPLRSWGCGLSTDTLETGARRRPGLYFQKSACKPLPATPREGWSLPVVTAPAGHQHLWGLNLGPVSRSRDRGWHPSASAGPQASCVLPAPLATQSVATRGMRRRRTSGQAGWNETG